MRPFLLFLLHLSLWYTPPQASSSASLYLLCILTLTLVMFNCIRSSLDLLKISMIPRVFLNWKSWNLHFMLCPREKWAGLNY
jgi:hypothetical protein